MAQAPGPAAGPALDEKMAEEVLRQAQEVIRVQLSAGDALEAKLTTLLAQATTLLAQAVQLAVASLGAASLAEGAAGWLPPWAAAGFLISSVGWFVAAVTALRGLRAKDWYPPGFEPRNLWRSEVLQPDRTAAGFLYVALAMSRMIEDNRPNIVDLKSALAWTRSILLLSPLLGLVGAWVVFAGKL